MAEQTQSNEQILGSGSVREVDPDTSFGDVALIESVQGLIPKYQGYNPHHLKNRLVNDSEFFKEMSTSYFNATSTDEERALFDEDPDARQKTYERFTRNFYKEIVKDAYVGQLESTTLINRSVNLQQTKKDLPLDRYKTLIEGNQDQFEGLIGFDNDEALSTFILNNEDVHKELAQHSYKQFEQELSKSHNTSALFDNVTKKAQAYAVYETFGSEGLTQYVNALQYPKDSDDLAKVFESREEAINFFENARAGDSTAKEVVKEFIVGNKVKDVPYADSINEASLNTAVSPALLASMFNTESAFKPDSISTAGAGGIAQFQATTGREMGLTVPDELYDLDKQRIEATSRGDHEEAARLKKELQKATRKYKGNKELDERFDPEKSIEASAKLLSKHLERFNGDPRKAVAAYNAGAGRVIDAEKKAEQEGGDWFSHLPSYLQETIEHVPKVMNGIEQYGTLDITHTPLTPRQELQTVVPEDTNYYTANFYQGDKDGNIVDADESQVYEAFIRKHVPENYQPFLQLDTLQESIENTKEGRSLIASVYKEAVEEGSFTMNDLLETFKAKGAHSVDEDGRDFWYLNVDDFDKKTLIAYNAARIDDDVDQMFGQATQAGLVKFTPQRLEKFKGMQRDFLNTLFSTKKVAVRNEDGTVTTEETADHGILSQLYNSAVTVGYGLGEGIGKYVFEPIVRNSADLYSSLFGEEAGEMGQWLSDGVSGYFSTNLSEGLNAETDGIMPSAIGEVMPFVQIIGAIYGMGLGVIKGGAAGLSAITKVKSANDLVRMSGAMGGASRLQGISAKLNRAVGNKSAWAGVGGKGMKPWMTAGGTFYAGEQVFELTQPERERLINVIPEMLGAEPTNDFRMAYLRASDTTRLGMNAGASLMTTTFIDGLIGLGRYGTQMARYARGKRDFRSFMFDETTGKFSRVKKPEFYMDIMEFGKNLTSGLDELPLGTIGKYKADGFEFETLADAAKTFVDNTDDVAGHVKKDIEDHVRSINRSLADEPLTDTAVKQIVDEQYDYFLTQTADQLEGLMKQGGEDLPLKFADRLENGVFPSAKEFKPEGERILPTQIEQYREKGYNVFEKDGVVYEASPQFWTVDLAQKIREKSLTPSTERIIRNEAKKAGINFDTPTATQAEQLADISRDVRYIVGKQVEVDGNVGYVVDIADDGFVIRTADGDVTVNDLQVNTLRPTSRFSPISSEIPEQQRRQQVTDVINTRLSNAVDNTSSRFKKLTEAERELTLPDRKKTTTIIDRGRQYSQDFYGQPQTVNDGIGRTVTYQGQRGVLQLDDAGFPVVRSGDQMYELPSLKNMNQPLDELGVRPVSVYDEGLAMIDDQIYSYRQGLDDFKFKNGQPVEVTLRNPNGVPRKFTDKDIVEEMYLARMSGETGQQFTEQLNRGWKNSQTTKLSESYMQRLRQYADTYYDVATSRTRIPFC